MKRQLRKHIRERKSCYTADELRRMSENVCRQLLAHPRVMEADTVVLYWSLPDEVSTHDLIAHLHAQGKTILLPKVTGETTMELRRYDGPSSLAMGSFGIMEPQGPVVTCVPEGGVALIPGMAFTRDGCRMGRGRGYYDRLLQRMPYIYKIGVAWPFQILQQIPCDEHDVRMDDVKYG